MADINTTTTSDQGTSWQHPQYTKTAAAVRRMRVSIEGENAVKLEEEALLPHPCLDAAKHKDDDQKARYAAYLAFAEYDNIPGNTLEALIGAMFRVDPTADLNPSIEYAQTDLDGNGVPLAASLELTASECLVMRYHGLLVEYSDLAGEDISDVTVEAAARLNLRAYVKHYVRDSICNWSFKVVNGARRLNMVVLKEEELQAFDAANPSSTGYSLDKVESYLILALDDEGHYFQRRYIQQGHDDTEGQWSEPIYPMANGQMLDFIPFEIVYSTERKVGDIPKQLGYLDPISVKSIHRYQVSAFLKEALRITAQPTSYSTGWTQNSFEQYKQATGNEHIVMGAGAHIPLFGDATVGYLEWDADSNGLFKYMENSKAEIIALGGLFDESGEEAETATAATINSAEKKGTLSTLAKNIEQSYAKVFGWMDLFMTGAQSDTSSVKLTRDFVAVRLSATDRQQIVSEYIQGAIPREEMYRQFAKGGVLEAEVDQIIDELENSSDGVV